MCVKGAANVPAVFDGTKQESDSKRQQKKVQPVFLIGFVMKMYVSYQVVVNNSTFDELKRNRNNKTITDIVSSLLVAVFLCFFLDFVFHVDCSSYDFGETFHVAAIILCSRFEKIPTI